MKSINIKDFLPVGIVAKSHGNKGEVRISLHTSVKIKEWVFVEHNQKPVPFFIEQKNGTYPDYIFKLKGINTKEDAENLKNKIVLLPKNQIISNKHFANEDIIDFIIIDEQVGEIGKVASIISETKQPLLQTSYQNKELLIPAVEPIIIDINFDEKVIYTNLPDGFLNI
ncbi:MAG: ribosome maturation factor RimM [Bacteroidia bacterium]